jgi:hypothetical protein
VISVHHHHVRNREKAPANEPERASKKRNEGPQRRRGGSSSQGGGSNHPQRFIDRERAGRFRVIDDWNFIVERRVELRDGECQEFTGMLTLRNWWPIASLLEKFDPEIVKEFYANAFGEKKARLGKKSPLFGASGCRTPPIGSTKKSAEESFHQSRATREVKGWLTTSHACGIRGSCIFRRHWRGYATRIGGLRKPPEMEFLTRFGATWMCFPNFG